MEEQVKHLKKWKSFLNNGKYEMKCQKKAYFCCFVSNINWYEGAKTLFAIFEKGKKNVKF